MKRCVTLGAALCLAAGVAGCSGDNAGAPPIAAAAPIAAATFDVTDEAGLSSNSKCNTTGPDGLRCCHASEMLRTLEC